MLETCKTNTFERNTLIFQETALITCERITIVEKLHKANAICKFLEWFVVYL